MPAAYDLRLSLDFLNQLSANNDREWFQAHKDQYTAAYEQMIRFADAVLAELLQHDQIETPTGKKSLYRIYRDVRFSKNKQPYKNNFAGGFRRATRWLRGGYYFQIQPGRSFVAGGFWGPNPQDLLHIRRQIAQDPDALRDVLQAPEFVQYFGQLQGEQLKTSPKGFDKDDPAIDLLRYKQFLVSHSFSDREVCAQGFHKTLVQGFLQMRPFFDYMSDILTTDLNGEELVDLK